MKAYLDTNVVIRLAIGDLSKISKEAQQAMNRYDLLISPMVLVELQYAFEIKRVIRQAEAIFKHLQRTIDLQICQLPFEHIASAALLESWTQDAFDRIIVSQARCAQNSFLITADEKIQKHYMQTICS